ncbi:MAG: hypothetical protein OEX07_12045 [Gammaproteobacteria bacterium]|nr:hypothetical protein [Gammaproteobacteria bacterium]
MTSFTQNTHKKLSTLLFLAATASSQLAMADTSNFTSNKVTLNKNPLDIGLSALFAAGGSSVGETSIANLQGGGHDPNRIGFTIQNVELSLGGAVDPFFDGQTNIIFQINDEGETVIELEEAYVISKKLPYGLQLKAGQFFTEFGRLNNQHPHTWAFSDQPVILSRLFGGDGLRSQGARIAWLTPMPWYSEVYVGVQNARGETTSSFISDAKTENTERSINGADDFLYSARWLNGFDITDSVSSNLGVSALWGPNSSSATNSNQTTIYGIDYYLKWQADVSQGGYPFIAWHNEYLVSTFENGDAQDKKDLTDNGWFSQLSYGYKKGWVAGIRLEQAKSNINDSADPATDDRFRTALNLTWFPTEYSKLRLQYNNDQAEHLSETAHSLWLQLEFNLGSHAAHVF